MLLYCNDLGFFGAIIMIIGFFKIMFRKEPTPPKTDEWTIHIRF